ncbi:MAG: siderophore-interacting protein [Micrococcaceae bacterium]
MRELPTFTGPNTTGTTQINFIDPVGRRLLQVARVEEITPRYRRIVFTGDDLATGFPWVDFAPADHVKLFFPNPQTGELVFPTITAKGWEFPEGAGDPLFRDYTVRAYDDAARELTIDFVVHDHGVAGVWARDAQPGDELGVLGPRGNVLFPENYAYYIAAGDETALPAIARLIEEAPADARVTAVIEVADEQEIQPLGAGREIDIQWLLRDSAPVGEGHLGPLETAVRNLVIDDVDSVFVFAAGEASALKPIRRYLRRELGLPKDQVDVDGYWKKGTANLDHHSNELAEDDD